MSVIYNWGQIFDSCRWVIWKKEFMRLFLDCIVCAVELEKQVDLYDYKVL